MALPDKFTVYKDDGTAFRVRTIRSRIPVDTPEHGREYIEGWSQLRLDDGSPLNMIDEYTFKPMTGELVHRKR